MKKTALYVICLSLLFLVSCKNSTSLDLSDYEALSDEYLIPIATAGISAENWNNPDDIPPEYFDVFYAIKALPAQRNSDSETMVSESEYESFIQQYFTVSSEHLKMSSAYDAEKKQYTIGYLGSSAPLAVIGANLDDDLLVLDYEYYSRADGTTLIRTGTIKIKVSEDDYKYVSCNSKEME